jgi:N utilization substance protein A
MTRMLLQTIEQIGREKNIAPEVIVDAIEEAMAVAAKKYYRTEEELEAKLNRETGEVDVYVVKQVVETVSDDLLEMSIPEAQKHDAGAEAGDVVRIHRSTEELGRIAAQAAKQVIFQKVRDAERENIFNEFIERVGELVTGIVKRFERGDMVIDLGRTEGLLPRREQSRAEHYNIGDRIRVVIIDVLKVSRGPQIVVSRVNPELLMRLFEMEVPEIYDGTVLIKGAVREGGDRAKVAVHSVELDVDPVGACVGMRGARVQSIIRELRGEKIDIVQWSSDVDQYAINALKPARVNRVSVVEGEEGHLEVIVDEDQLSLAIGKRGQNVRLAGKLLNIKIDIKSEDDKRKEVEKTLARMALREVDVASLPGVGPQTALVFAEAGISTIGEVAEAGIEGLVEVPGVGAKTAEKLHAAALEALEAVVEENEPSPEAVLPPLEASAEASNEEGTAEDREASAVLASMVMDSAEAESEESSEPEAPQE